jgi:glycosyltransferase involved in cell wall biosynthesis
MSILYISYDGILEPLGQSQVLSYLERLSKDRDIYLISFEKLKDKENQYLLNRISNRINKTNIKWYPLKYHKNPTAIATSLDVMYATILGLWLAFKYKLTIVHARSYVPSISALVIKKILGVKYIFDMRGFWADERIDGDIWHKNSRLYRIAKRFERLFLLNADVVISLTHKAVTEMESFPYLSEKTMKFEVITTCTDLELFRPNINPNNYEKQDENFTVGYVGSVGVWYMFEEALDCFKLIKKVIPHARLHIINKGGHDYIHKHLNNAGIKKESFTLETTDQLGVANAMQLMDVGLFIIKPYYSKISSMPTKLGEFLGCGVPCICNGGVGDMEGIVKDKCVGVVLNSFDKNEKSACVLRLLELIKDPEVNDRCRDTALEYFSLEDGVDSYNNVYNSLDIKYK